MEKKLTLREIAPYLPYGLKMIFEKSGKIIELSGIELSESEKLIFIHKNAFFESTKWNFKPILRPLSDLTKEIEHNGEKFVPIKKLGINKMWLGINDYHIHVYNQPYSEVQQLLEWHFDIFGLIEAGLAIDINTLEQH